MKPIEMESRLEEVKGHLETHINRARARRRVARISHQPFTESTLTGGVWSADSSIHD